MRGFTMAEILLSLTIIGVVAAITLPSLTGNINERTWNTQRKALYARFSQAISLMPAINGYGTLKEVTDSTTGSTSIEDNAAETFVTAGLSKVLKINNICDNDHLTDCGISSKITTLGGIQIDIPKTMQELNSNLVGSYSNSVDHASMLDTKAAAFETANSESIIVYYNPGCVGSFAETGHGKGGYYAAPKICANFLFDLNGDKGPNTVGKDIGFITAMYPSDVKIAAPYPANSPLSGTFSIKSSGGTVGAMRACTNYDTEYRLPNVDELISMWVNNIFLQGSSSGLNTGQYLSSTQISYNNINYVYEMIFSNGTIDDALTTYARRVWCIKR